MNKTNLRIRDASGWTMFVFGLMAVLFGIIGLVRPEMVFSILGLDNIERARRAAGDNTIAFIVAASMASFNMGAYYILAALNDQRAFYLWTVPFRAVTFSVFTGAALTGVAPIGWIGLGVWELCGSIATGLALYFEKRRPPAVV
jgi:hypothetical protein